MDLRSRLRKLEQNAGAGSMTRDADCTCFPLDEQPQFGSEEEKQAALEVLCPLHGLRFNPSTPTVYKSEWLRQSEQEGGYAGRSEQYRKTLNATEKGSK
jgi:hypothetical protein